MGLTKLPELWYHHDDQNLIKPGINFFDKNSEEQRRNSQRLADL
jgi:hypothetical protein